MKPKIENEYPIDPIITNRWSGRAYNDEVVAKETLMSLFEAARWSASAFNEQPWRFIVGVKGDKNYRKIFDVLGEFNQKWAKDAQVLVQVIAKKQFSQNDKDNIHCWYDTGQAMANLSIQATKLNLNVHQMAGFDRIRAQDEIVKDENFDPVCVAAIGYRGNADQLPEGLKEREYAQQERKPLDEIVTMI